MRTVMILALCLSCFALLAFAFPYTDDAVAILMARAERPSDPDPGAAIGACGGARTGERGGDRGGILLFRFYGADNGECVRSIPDINQDGLDEILVGINKSGEDNIFCLDGASSGTATVLWSIETADGVSGGMVYGDFSLNPSSDVDNNGFPNILAGTSWGGRTAYNLDGKDGSTVWKLDTYTLPDSGWVYSLCECGDVNNDGVPDAAFGAGSYCDTLFMVDGASTGASPNVLWDYKAPDAIMRVACIGDANRDNIDDVVAASADNGDLVLCRSGANGGHIWSYSANVYGCGVMPDVNGDGVKEAVAIVWTMDGSAIRCINGASGYLLWASKDVNEYGMAVDILEDVTGDGIAEVIAASWENAVTVLNGADGSLVWKTMTGTVNGGDVWTARAIDDLNGDGRQDVIAGSFDKHVYALDGDSGEIFWRYKTDDRILSVYPVGDLNNDGRPEVAAGSQDHNTNWVAYVLEGDADIPWPGLTLLGTGAIGQSIGVEVTGDPGATVLIMFSTGTGSKYYPAYGTLELAIPFHTLPFFQIPGTGPFVASGMVPNDPGLIGFTLYFQALVGFAPGDGAFTDMESVTFF